MAFLPILSLCVSLVHGHFEMLRPQPRTVGTMASQKIFPCAGAATPSATRFGYSALNQSIELTFYWDGDNDILLGLGYVALILVQSSNQHVGKILKNSHLKLVN